MSTHEHQLVERVAEAIFQSDQRPSRNWKRESRTVREQYLRNARAAIAAVREVGLRDYAEPEGEQAGLGDAERLEALVRRVGARSVEIVPLADGRFAAVIWRVDAASPECGGPERTGYGANGVTIDDAIRAAIAAAFGEDDRR